MLAKLRWASVLAATVLIVAIYVFGAIRRKQPTLPTAILYRALKMHGGSQAIRATLRGMWASSTQLLDVHLLSPYKCGEQVTLLRKNDRLLILQAAGGTVRREFLSKSQDWAEIDGVVSHLSASDISTMLHYLSSEVALRWLMEANQHKWAVTDLGWIILPDGRQAQGLNVLSDHVGVQLYFDHSTGLLAAFEHSFTDSGKKRTTEMDCYLDYQWQFGTAKPLHVAYFRDGRQVMDVKMRWSKAVCAVSDVSFHKPSPPKGWSDTAVPLEYSHGRPLVYASVNGQRPYKFILDTGSYVTHLSRRLADQLHLRSTGELVEQQMWNPEVKKVTHLASLRIGGAIAHNLTVCINEPDWHDEVWGSDYGGNLGYNFLGRFLVTIDYPARRAIFASPGSPILNGEPESAAIDTTGIWVNATTAGHTCRLMLDTGSERTYLPPDVAPQLKLPNPQKADVQSGVTTYQALLRSLTVDGRTVTNTVIYFGDPKWETFVGHVPSPGLLGNSFLNHFRVSIDFDRQQVWLTEE